MPSFETVSSLYVIWIHFHPFSLLTDLNDFNLQENEKLYLQMKALQAQNKQNEEAMFAENQKLLTELAINK